MLHFNPKFKESKVALIGVTSVDPTLHFRVRCTSELLARPQPEWLFIIKKLGLLTLEVPSERVNARFGHRMYCYLSFSAYCNRDSARTHVTCTTTFTHLYKKKKKRQLFEEVFCLIWRRAREAAAEGLCDSIRDCRPEGRSWSSDIAVGCGSRSRRSLV
jgi:hypothetical protein